MPELKSDTEALAAQGGTRRMKAILVLAGAAIFAAAPRFTEGFGGFAPDLFPIPQDRPPVQPAGYAFAIWLPIYAGLIAHAAFGLFARAEDRGWDSGRWPLIVSLGVGAGWLAVANASAVWATVLIWVMLAGALAALALTGRHAGWPARSADRWLGVLPLGLYAGWLTAAAWVSVGLMLGGFGLLSESWAAVAALLAAVAMAVVTQLWLWRAPEYGLTVIWALLAVVVANAGAGRLALAALAVLGALAVAAAVARVLRG